MGNRGQSLIEAVLALPLMILVGAGLVSILYRSLVFHYADYQTHEALICTQFESSHYCQRELESKIKKILVSKTALKIQISKSWTGSPRASVEIDLQTGLQSLRMPIKIEKTLRKI